MYLAGASVHHKDCCILLSPDSSTARCVACVRQRASLSVQAKRLAFGDKDDSKTAPSSHTNYRYLSKPELIERLSKEHHQRQLLSKQCQRLKAKISQATEEVGVSVSAEIHEDLRQIMVEKQDQVLKSFPPNSFQVGDKKYHRCRHSFYLLAHVHLLCRSCFGSSSMKLLQKILEECDGIH